MCDALSLVHSRSLRLLAHTTSTYFFCVCVCECKSDGIHSVSVVRLNKSKYHNNPFAIIIKLNELTRWWRCWRWMCECCVRAPFQVKHTGILWVLCTEPHHTMVVCRVFIVVSLNAMAVNSSLKVKTVSLLSVNIQHSLQSASSFLPFSRERTASLTFSLFHSHSHSHSLSFYIQSLTKAFWIMNWISVAVVCRKLNFFSWNATSEISLYILL